jgi:hypothetical protein
LLSTEKILNISEEKGRVLGGSRDEVLLDQQRDVAILF